MANRKGYPCLLLLLVFSWWFSVGMRAQCGHISRFFKKMQGVWIFMWNLPILKCWREHVQKHREPNLAYLCAEFSPGASRVQPLGWMMSKVFATSERIWPNNRLSLQSVRFWLSVLFLLQFKQSGRGLKCNRVYKHPEEFHMVCRMWSWLNLKRLNVLRQFQSCLFCKSMRVVSGRPGRDELWEVQLVWPGSPVAGAEEASQCGRCSPELTSLPLCTTHAHMHTNTTHGHSPHAPPPLWFSLLLLNLKLIQMKNFYYVEWHNNEYPYAHSLVTSQNSLLKLNSS